MHQVEKNFSELVLSRNTNNNNGTGPQARNSKQCSSGRQTVDGAGLKGHFKMFGPKPMMHFRQ